MPETKSKSKAKARPVIVRIPLAEADEKKAVRIGSKYKSESWGAWAERYARKCLKVKQGLRATPAPVPPEMPPDVAKTIRESILGKDAPKVARKPAAKKAPAKAKPAAKKAAPSKKAPARKPAAKAKAQAAAPASSAAIGSPEHAAQVEGRLAAEAGKAIAEAMLP